MWQVRGKKQNICSKNTKNQKLIKFFVKLTLWVVKKFFVKFDFNVKIAQKLFRSNAKAKINTKSTQCFGAVGETVVTQRLELFERAIGE